MSKVERISRFDIERLIEVELVLIDWNSTKNYKVYEDMNGFRWCFSYDTLVALLDWKGVPAFTWFAQGYSSTTTRHTGTFIREFGDNYYSKNYTPKWLRELIKDNEAVCYDYEINNLEELFQVLTKSYNMNIIGKRF